MEDAKCDESASSSHELAPQYRRDETSGPFTDNRIVHRSPCTDGWSAVISLAIHCAFAYAPWSVEARLIGECLGAGLVKPR